MKFEVIDTVAFPVEDVYTTMRDKLPDLVPHLPDVKQIVCKERSETDDGRVHIVNHWHADGETIPKALRAFVKPEQLGWIDHATWNDAEKSVEWKLEMQFFSEYVDVHGKNTFSDDGNGKTRFLLSGDLNLDLASHPKIPRLLAKSITGQVEKLVLKLVKPNLVKVNRGLEKHLAQG